MFSHESIALIALFSILLIGVLAAVLHPLHALASWIRRRRNRFTKITQEVDSQ